MEILTEFDGLQEALKKVNMDEAVLPYCNGRLVDSDAFNKTQKILNCPEMISAHKYLYNLDMDQLTEEETEKIDQLYKLGCDRGFIVDDLTNWDADTEAPTEDKAAEEKPAEEPAEKTVAGTLFKAKVPCWTVIYSATSADGDIKTGEAYSNAVTPAAAKADVNAKLSRVGYSNISILAIEAADECVCAGTCAKEDVKENDMLRNKPHNGHIDDPSGVVAEEEKEKEDAGTDEKASEDDDKSEDDSESTEDEASDETSDEDDAADAEEDSDSAEDEEKSDETSDNESSEDDSTEDKKDDSADEPEEKPEEDEDSSEEDSKPAEDEEKSDEESNDKASEDASEDDEKKELDANEKSELKDKYRRTFKNVLSKCKFECSFNDLTLEQKVKFFTELSKAWKKNEPSEFMTDKEIEQLNNVVVKEGAED